MPETTEKKQKEIMEDVLYMIHFNECPRCNEEIREVLTSVDENDIVLSAELICKSCGFSVGFGGSSAS